MIIPKDTITRIIQIADIANVTIIITTTMKIPTIIDDKTDETGTIIGGINIAL